MPTDTPRIVRNGQRQRFELADAPEQGLTIVPRCAFVASWLERHPERAAELDVRQP